MSEQQFNIVKTFLHMGNSAQRIADEFKADFIEVLKADQSASYDQYQNFGFDSKSRGLFDDLGNMFGNNG